MTAASATKPFRISVLLFVRDASGRHLLIQRRKEPNKGLWSPMGGKLEMALGESPFECARREAFEESGMMLEDKDLHLFSMISEKGYEGTGHWMMFLFDVLKPIGGLPDTIDEGRFGFFADGELATIAMPETDREALWGVYRRHRRGFVCMRADCNPGKPLEIVFEQVIGS